MVLQESFIGALLPTLSGRSVTGNPQVWYTGSAVDQHVHEHGVVFARIRERGLDGNDPSLAYFEWSAADAFDADGKPITPETLDESVLADRDAWARANPGLGVRISEEHIENERRSMAARTFAVERLGVGDYPPTDAGALTVLDLTSWDSLADPDSRIAGSAWFALDVRPDRSAAAIAAAGQRPDGRAHVEIVDHGRGTGWVVERLREVVERQGAAAVVYDAAGPAASLAAELEASGVPVTSVSATDHARACGLIFDRVDQETLRHLGTSELRAAIHGAAQRPLGDAWAWSRKNSTVDISPLVAATLALWAAATIEVSSGWGVAA
jgi:hypothetical protein